MPSTDRCPRRWPLAAGLALLASALALLPSPAQDVLPAPRRLQQQPEKLDPPRREPLDEMGDLGMDRNQRTVPLLPVDYPGGLYPAIPVTLPDVLKLAVLSNLDVVQANLAVERARLALVRANAQ